MKSASQNPACGVVILDSYSSLFYCIQKSDQVARTEAILGLSTMQFPEYIYVCTQLHVNISCKAKAGYSHVLKLSPLSTVLPTLIYSSHYPPSIVVLCLDRCLCVSRGPRAPTYKGFLHAHDVQAPTYTRASLGAKCLDVQMSRGPRAPTSLQPTCARCLQAPTYKGFSEC